MINNNLISSKQIILRVLSDLDLNENQIQISNFREWIGQAMEKIGAITQLAHKVAVIPVQDHQAKLPCDLYRLGQVAFSFCNSAGWLPMRKSTSSFGVYCNNKCSNACMLVKDQAMFPLVKNMFNLTTDKQALDKLNSDKELRSTLSTLLNCYTVNTVNGKFTGTNTNFSNELQYMTKPGYIMTNVPEGFVKIEYYSIYTDDDGMPMIPDMESYKEAIFWYIVMKWMYIKKIKGQIDAKTYYDAQTSWNFYRKQAYTEAMIPSSVDDLDTIKNIWHKLYPEIDDQDLFMSTTGEEQNIYNHNY